MADQSVAPRSSKISSAEEIASRAARFCVRRRWMPPSANSVRARSKGPCIRSCSANGGGQFGEGAVEIALLRGEQSPPARREGQRPRAVQSAAVASPGLTSRSRASSSRAQLDKCLGGVRQHRVDARLAVAHAGEQGPERGQAGCGLGGSPERELQEAQADLALDQEDRVAGLLGDDEPALRGGAG